MLSDDAVSKAGDTIFRVEDIVNSALAHETAVDLRDNSSFVGCMTGIDGESDELTFVFRLARGVTGRKGKAEKASAVKGNGFYVPRGDIARMAPMSHSGLGFDRDHRHALLYLVQFCFIAAYEIRKN